MFSSIFRRNRRKKIVAQTNQPRWKTGRRNRWYHSIRWRMALGSMCVTFFSTLILVVAVILAITYYYSRDQSSLLASFAADGSQSIGTKFIQDKFILAKAASDTYPNALEQNFQGEQYLVIVFNRRDQPIYPHFAPGQNTLTNFYVALADPGLKKGDFVGLRAAIVNTQRQGIVSTGELGSGNPAWLPRPYIVQPIFAGGQPGGLVVGVLVVTPQSAALNTVPPFISAVGLSVILSASIVLVLAFLAALLFSRTITRPIARLTKAARVLTAGDYSAQVT